MAYDLVIRNGTVVDGSGMPGYRADVAIEAGVINRIGRVREAGRQEIDATGLAVTPGFIDGHTHMDAQVFWDELGTNSCWHGVTTVVMGHCGFTIAPARPDGRELVVRNLERAEDIPGTSIAAGIDWTWTTFREYLDAVDRRPKGINYAANVGHSALRAYVMGERAFTDEATDADVAAMAVELRDALEAGAYGFTTSRTSHHRTTDDEPVASRLATWDEVVQLVGVLSDLEVGLFQFVEDPPPLGPPNQDERLLHVAVDMGVPIVIAGGSDRAMSLTAAAAAAGGRIHGMSHTRGIGAITSFRTALPFDRLPGWRELRALPLDEQRRRLEDPKARAELVRIAHEGPYGEAAGAEARKPEYDRLQVFDDPVRPNRTVADVARERGLDPVDLMIALGLETDFRQLFFQTFMPWDEAAAQRYLEHPYNVMTFSDSGAHVSQISDSSIQTHLLAYWVRTTGRFGFEEAIRMITLAPARAWGFHDRGLVREGLVADLNVIDPATVAPVLPEVVRDLPAGERRLVQRAVGIRATIVGGEIVIDDGADTGARPGRLIRGPLAAK